MYNYIFNNSKEQIACLNIYIYIYIYIYICNLQFGIYRIPHTVICCLLFVSACLYLTNAVAVQLTLRARAYRMSHNIHLSDCVILYTLCTL